MKFKSKFKKSIYLTALIPLFFTTYVSAGTVYMEESFSYTGSPESLDVSEYDQIEVMMTGAGGGGAGNDPGWFQSGRQEDGGDGGYLNAIFDVSEIDNLEIYVGGGGEGGEQGTNNASWGGWGRASGGKGSESNTGGSDAGGGGGSTEILGDGIFLGAADAGGGGGAYFDTRVGSNWRHGGGGGGSGGDGGVATHGIQAHGEDAETSSRDGASHEGGDGGRGATHPDPGEDGGYSYNSSYLVEVKNASRGGGASGGAGRESSSGGADGANGSVTVRAIQLAEPDPEEFTLTVEVIPSEGGAVFVQPEDGPSNLVESYDTFEIEEDIDINLSAAPNNRWGFEGWSGSISESDPETTIVLDGPATVIAEFIDPESLGLPPSNVDPGSMRTDKRRADPAFENEPTSPRLEEKTTFYPSSGIEGDAPINRWEWVFEDAEPEYASGEEVSTEFKERGSMNATMEVRDTDGVWCTDSRNIDVQEILPEWEEIDPFSILYRKLLAGFLM